MVQEKIDRIQEELQFVRKYRERLVTRRKHGTIREGKRIPASMKLPVRITETGEYLGEVAVEEVRWLRLKEIATPEILRYEYPSNPKELRKDLIAIYPNLTDESWVTFFRFRFTDEAETTNE